MPLTLRRTTTRVLAAMLLLVGVSVSAGTQAPPAYAASGYCPDDSGVTVVVDFGALGGGTSVRCAPGPVGTGVQSLQRAGFSTEGTRKDGPGFVCRIAGRPSASDVLSVGGGEYREQCVLTPLPSAYWHYFYASNGGSWIDSPLGAANRTAIAGGFEGWAFWLGGSPKPGVAPVRPAAPAPEPPPAPDPAAPPPAAAAVPVPAAPGVTKPRTGTGARSSSPSAVQSAPAAAAPAPADGVGEATSAPAPTDAVDPSSPPTDTSLVGTGTPGPTATDDVAVTAAESQAEEASVATALGVGLLAFFTAAAGTTALRRRRQR